MLAHELTVHWQDGLIEGQEETVILVFPGVKIPGLDNKRLFLRNSKIHLLFSKNYV